MFFFAAPPENEKVMLFQKAANLRLYYRKMLKKSSIIRQKNTFVRNTRTILIFKMPGD
jgi:hypothetical protein